MVYAGLRVGYRLYCGRPGRVELSWYSLRFRAQGCLGLFRVKRLGFRV